VRKDLFLPTPEGEGRLLLLIDAFTGDQKSLEGRTKLAKLDFFLRYPRYLDRAIAIRTSNEAPDPADGSAESIEQRMVRYRYGPWDPAYFALLGSLIGRGLVIPASVNAGIGYRATERGRDLAARLSTSPAWADTASRTKLLRRHLDLSGSNLKNFVYNNFPEVAGASWGDIL
jgi:hypothetical protein